MDRHADARDRKRHKKRYGPTTTNPGLRKIARDLAAEAQQGCPVCGQVGVHRSLTPDEQAILDRSHP